MIVPLPQFRNLSSKARTRKAPLSVFLRIETGAENGLDPSTGWSGRPSCDNVANGAKRNLHRFAPFLQ
jgi:hypothetical protein